MNIEELVHDTFTEHEHLAPREQDVLVAVHERMHHRPRQKRYLAVAATVAVVAGAATAVAMLAGGDPAPTHHPIRSAAASVHNAPAPKSTARAKTITPLAMPFDLGWLPAGKIDYVARRINVGGVSRTSRPSFDGEYMLTAHVDGTAIDIDVQQMPGGLGGLRSKCSAMTAVRIAGRPGYATADASGPCGYELYFRDAGNRTMYVNVAREHGTHNAAAEMSRIGRRIAENIRYPGTTTVQPSFGIGHVPRGLRVVAFDCEADGAAPGATEHIDNATSYEIGNSVDPVPPVSAGVSVLPAKGKAGRSVQGHRTLVSSDHGYRSIAVLDAVGGHAVVIQSSLPFGELYKIADGLVLPK